jgi:hypothetical protein
MRLALSALSGACHTAARPTALLSAYFAAHHARNDDSQVIERTAANDEMRMK